MKKVLLLTIGLCLLGSPMWAGHITGGEMYYTYLGQQNGLYRYSVTLKLYQRCNSSRNFPDPAIVSVFDRTNGNRVADLSTPLTRLENINLPNTNPCITNPPLVCYDVAYYTFTVSLPATAEGYILSSQVNFRVAGIRNLKPGYSAVGATYTAEIPGNQFRQNAPENNSARFIGDDLVLVCAGNAFRYSFEARDPDGDELRYHFCGAYNSTASGGGTYAPEPPPYPTVPYDTPAYSESTPLGGIGLQPNNGLIEGTAPEPGIYVVTVCVEEYRRGTLLSVQRKDIQLNVADCQIAAARLDPVYPICGPGFDITLFNRVNSPVILTSEWEIRDRTGTRIHLTTADTLRYRFADTGLYTAKLTINRGRSCADSATALLRVYPGFEPGFAVSGTCFGNSTRFRDTSRSRYGRVTTWSWDFGDPSTGNDRSNQQNPEYRYPQTGTKAVRLIAGDSQGCIDTVEQVIRIADRADLRVGFRDTLICRNDVLQLESDGNGRFRWSPDLYLSDAGSPRPLASPPQTITYVVDLDDNGCLNRDSIRVRVVDYVTLELNRDTTICTGDTTRLPVRSDALQFRWSPAASVLDPAASNPRIWIQDTTVFRVTATIGGCSATDSIRVATVPYPTANAGTDRIICYGTGTTLTGRTDGRRWYWTPSSTLNDPASLTPQASPRTSTNYIFLTFDDRGCPKPGRDTVWVQVRPRMQVSAGRDTAVVVGQPLLLRASGGSQYLWSPSDRLSDPRTPEPVATFESPAAGLTYQVRATDIHGCTDSARVRIRVYRAGPVIFLPSAFTPNGDGRNDVLRPLAAGIRQIRRFSIYNRWGKLVFSTTRNGAGWDGTLNGQLQDTGTYAWFAEAEDYEGKLYSDKGVVTLIR